MSHGRSKIDPSIVILTASPNSLNGPFGLNHGRDFSLEHIVFQPSKAQEGPYWNEKAAVALFPCATASVCTGQSTSREVIAFRLS